MPTGIDGIRREFDCDRTSNLVDLSVKTHSNNLRPQDPLALSADSNGFASARRVTDVTPISALSLTQHFRGRMIISNSVAEGENYGCNQSDR